MIVCFVFLFAQTHCLCDSRLHAADSNGYCSESKSNFVKQPQRSMYAVLMTMELASNTVLQSLRSSTRGKHIWVMVMVNIYCSFWFKKKLNLYTQPKQMLACILLCVIGRFLSFGSELETTGLVSVWTDKRKPLTFLSYHRSGLISLFFFLFFTALARGSALINRLSFFPFIFLDFLPFSFTPSTALSKNSTSCLQHIALRGNRQQSQRESLYQTCSKLTFKVHWPFASSASVSTELKEYTAIPNNSFVLG